MEKVLDLSEHNGKIDFEKVKNDGFTSIILRLGWIGNKNNHTIDKCFEEYYKEANKLNFKIGIYVYSYCRTMLSLESSFEFILKNLQNKKIELPIFLDLEDNSISDLSKNNLTSQSILFCEFFKKYGYNTGIYASKYWFLNKLDINKLLNYKIWLAEWTSNKVHSLGYKVDLWQFTDKGKVNGITGNVDISRCLCNCNEKEEKKEESFEMAKTYKNGSTIEKVYSDSLLKFEIGSLNKYEQCECLGMEGGHYIVKYKINGTNDYKVGFVKYPGGVK